MVWRKHPGKGMVDMAEQADLDATLARLEAALAAATHVIETSEAAPDLSGELDEVRAELAAAHDKIGTLEAAVTAGEAARDHALADVDVATEKAQADADEAKAQIAAAEARADAAEEALADVPEVVAAPDVALEETDRLRQSLTTLSASLDDLRAGADGAADPSLTAEVAALRAARELDLAEMKALLAELEPMLERADA